MTKKGLISIALLFFVNSAKSTDDFPYLLKFSPRTAANLTAIQYKKKQYVEVSYSFYEGQINLDKNLFQALNFVFPDILTIGATSDFSNHQYWLFLENKVRYLESTLNVKLKVIFNSDLGALEPFAQASTNYAFNVGNLRANKKDSIGLFGGYVSPAIPLDISSFEFKPELSGSLRVGFFYDWNVFNNGIKLSFETNLKDLFAVSLWKSLK